MKPNHFKSFWIMKPKMKVCCFESAPSMTSSRYYNGLFTCWSLQLSDFSRFLSKNETSCSLTKWQTCVICIHCIFFVNKIPDISEFFYRLCYGDTLTSDKNVYEIILLKQYPGYLSIFVLEFKLNEGKHLYDFSLELGRLEHLVTQPLDINLAISKKVRILFRRLIIFQYDLLGFKFEK